MVGDDRHLSLHAAVDDERPAGHAGRVGNESTDIGIADIHRRLRDRRADKDQRENGCKDQLLHWPAIVTTSGSIWPPRSIVIERLPPLAKRAPRRSRSFGPLMARPSIAVTMSPSRRPA